MHAAFYFYGRCLLYQDAYLLALRGSVLKEDVDIKSAVNAEGSGLFGFRYFGNYRPELEIDQNGRKLILRLKNTTLRGAFDLVSGSDWEYEASAASDTRNAVGHIRRLTRLSDLAKAAAEMTRQ